MKNAIQRLCKDLKLPLGQDYTQDWAYELPDQFRTQEWLSQFIIEYLAIKCFNQRRQILMDLMLDIINDYLLEHINPDTPIIQRVLDLLRTNKAEHQDIIEYWSVLGECNPEYYFKVTPFVRLIL